MKKCVEICGTIEVPLEKGCSAFIRKVGEEPFRTSTVKHFITMPSGLTYIQTENTHYYLHPPTRAAATKGGSGMKHKESKEDRFRRLAEARVNKIIPMIRLLGNLSNTGIYSYSRHQVEQIFTALQLELVKAKMRFLQPQGKRNKRFSLSEPYDLPEARTAEDRPAFVIPLPDGTYLRAVGFPNDDYPAINIYWDNGTNAPTETLCFVEFNQEKQGDMRVCIGTYRSDEEDTAYYGPYMAAERTSTDD